MREYVITTDSTVDLPKEYLREHQVQAVSLSYEIEGETYEDLNGLEPADFLCKKCEMGQCRRLLRQIQNR